MWDTQGTEGGSMNVTFSPPLQTANTFRRITNDQINSKDSLVSGKDIKVD